MKHVRRRKPLLVAAGLALAVGAGATISLLPHHSAQATETQVYSGNGWKLLHDSAYAVDSLSADGTGYTIEYADHHLQVGAEQAAKQLQSVTGITFTTKFVATMPAQNCASWPRHVLVLGSKWQPTGKTAYSYSSPCYQSNNHSAWGGWSWIDSEYWKVPNWASDDPALNLANTKNVITHEIGHLVGLDHPNKDLNRDGTVSLTECDKTVHGYLPLMCAAAGGYFDVHGGGQYTSMDISGLKQLVANYSLPSPSGVKPSATKSDGGAPHGVAVPGVNEPVGSQR